MNGSIKIIVLCSGKFAYASIQLLALEGMLGGIVWAGEDEEGSSLEKGIARSNIPFFKCNSLKKMDALYDWLAQQTADVIYSMCFPYRLPSNILHLYQYKPINFHTGPLPGYRGPMPIFEVLKAGESETALSVHFMDEGFDTGPLLFKEKVRINKTDTFGSLATKLADTCCFTVQTLSEMLKFGSILPSKPQTIEGSAYYSKPLPRDTRIEWEWMSVSEILNLIRACNPWNGGADTILFEKYPLKIIIGKEGDPYLGSHQPGDFLGFNSKGEALIACVDHRSLAVSVLKDEGGIFLASESSVFRNITPTFLKDIL